MIVAKSEFSDTPQTSPPYPGCHERRSLSRFGYTQILIQCGRIPHSRFHTSRHMADVPLCLSTEPILWAPALLISSDDRRVSDILFFHLQVRHDLLFGSTACCTISPGKKIAKSYGNSSLRRTLHYPLLAVPRSESGIQHFLQSDNCSVSAAFRRLNPSLPDRRLCDLRDGKTKRLA